MMDFYDYLKLIMLAFAIFHTVRYLMGYGYHKWRFTDDATGSWKKPGKTNKKDRRTLLLMTLISWFVTGFFFLKF